MVGVQLVEIQEVVAVKSKHEQEIEKRQKRKHKEDKNKEYFSFFGQSSGWRCNKTWKDDLPEATKSVAAQNEER